MHLLQRNNILGRPVRNTVEFTRLAIPMRFVKRFTTGLIHVNLAHVSATGDKKIASTGMFRAHMFAHVAPSLSARYSGLTGGPRATGNPGRPAALLLQLGQLCLEP
jgi:hypothetical protein